MSAALHPGGMANLKVRVDSTKVRYSKDLIEAEYEYQTTTVVEGDENDDDAYTVRTCSSIHLAVQSVPSMLVPAGQY